jgi:hypothetical protein
MEARCVAIVAAATALAGPASADAATATLSGARLSVTAGSGEANRINVAEDAGGFTITDFVPLAAGSGCQRVNAVMVRCPTSAAGRRVFVDARDGDNRVVLKTAVGTDGELRGGDGRDRLYGDDGNDLLLGGDGVDTLQGGPGFNTIDGGLGDDFLYGGVGRDRLSYRTRRRAVRVDLVHNSGGQRGEKDLLDEIEEVIGGRGADKLRGTKRPDVLLGGPGRAKDDVVGRGGADVLVGRRATGGGGSDRIDGRVLDCGGGRDTIVRDKYRPPSPFDRACESVESKFVVLRTRPLKSSRTAAVFSVRCRGARHCGGTLELRDARGRIGKKEFSLRRGRVRIRFRRPPSQRVVRVRTRNSAGKQRSSFRARLR